MKQHNKKNKYTPQLKNKNSVNSHGKPGNALKRWNFTWWKSFPLLLPSPLKSTWEKRQRSRCLSASGPWRFTIYNQTRVLQHLCHDWATQGENNENSFCFWFCSTNKKANLRTETKLTNSLGHSTEKQILTNAQHTTHLFLLFT